MSVIFQNGRCLVCGAPIDPRGEICSRRECRMVRAEFEDFTTLQFILTNVRWAGGSGLESLADLMEQAIRELPLSEERLGTLLIEIYESQSLPAGYSPW